jgi:NRPS condensation-like uncharacterized protein
MKPQLESSTRELGGLERQFYQQNLVGSTNIVCVLRVEGRLDSTMLKHALQRLLTYHLQLGAAIEAEPVIRFARLQSYALPYEESHETDWRRVLEAELHRHYPGPQIFLRHLASENSVLLLGLNHAVADGLSSLVLGRQLIELYNGKAIAVSLPRGCVESRFPKAYRGVRGWWKAVTFIFRLAKMGPALQIGSVAPTRSTGSLGFLLSETSFLNDEARRRGSNLFAVISAVVLKTLHELYSTTSEDSLSLNTPVSLRSAAKIPSDEIGVFLAGHLALYKINPHTDVWTLAQQCFETLKQGIAKGYPMLLTLLARGSRRPKPPKIPDKPSTHRPTVSISNLGRIETFPDAQGRTIVGIHAVSAQSMKDPFALVVASYQNKTAIDLQFSEQKMSRDEAQALLSAIHQKMLLLIEKSRTFSQTSKPSEID